MKDLHSLPTPPVARDSPPAQAMQALSCPVDYVERLSLELGDAFAIHPPVMPPIVFFSSPEAIARLEAGSRDGSFDVGRGNALIGSFDLAFGERSLVVLDGEAHQRLRQGVNRVLTDDVIVPRLIGARAIVDRQLDKWPRGRRFPLYDEVRRLAMRVMSHVVLGLVGDELDEFTEDLQRLLDSVEDRAQWLATHRRLSQAVDARIYEVIAARRERPGDDVASRLLREIRDPAPTSVELHDTLKTLVVLGHEGASATTTWALYYLHQAENSALLAEVRQEATAIAAADALAFGRARSPSIAKSLRETLRIRPVLIGVQRMPRKAMEIGGYRVDAGTVVSPCMYLVHHRADLWPDPWTFDASRFDSEPDDTTWFPFGLGARKCPGRFAGMHEMTFLLSEIVTRFDGDWQFSGEAPGTAIRGNILMPAAGLPTVIG